MPSKDGTMDDEKKSTKDVVNKKQKQFLNQEEKNVGREALRTAVSPFTKKIGTKVKSPNMTPDALQRFYKSSTGAASPLDNSHELKGKLIDEEEYDRYRDRIAMAGGDHRSKETRERSNTPTGKQPKGKTVMQKELEKKYGKGKSALDMVKADHKDEIMDVKKKKDKDVKEGAGLYANIHAKRKRGGKMRKKGAKGAPSAKDFANAAKTAREELDLTQVAEAFGGQIIETKTFTEKSFVEFRHQLNEINERNPFSIDKILGAGLSSANFIKKQLQRIPSIKIDPKNFKKVIDKIFKNKNKNTNPIKKKTVKIDKSENTKVDPREIDKKLKPIKRDKNKADTNKKVDSPPVEDNPLKDALTKVDKKTLQKIGGGVAGGSGVLIGVNQLTKNKTQTDNKPSPDNNRNKTALGTTTGKKGKKGGIGGFRFPSTQHTVGRRSNPQ